MSAEQLKELIPFLRDKNPQVRQIALSNLLGHTAKGSPHRNIFFTGLRSGGLQQAQDSDVIRDLKLLCRDQLATAHDAFRALVNLSDNSRLLGSSYPTSLCVLSLPIEMNLLTVHQFPEPPIDPADLASMLLSNLTASTTTCATLLSLCVSILPDLKSPTSYFPVDSRSGTCPAPVPYPSGEARDVQALPLLVDAFVHASNAGDVQELDKRNRKADLHFLSSVFANLSTSAGGRLFFLTPRPANPLNSEGNLEYPVSKLLAFTEHKDTIRRGGVASTLKNCAFQAQAHRALLAPESTLVTVYPSTVAAPGIDILPYILLPLAGPEEFDLEEQELLPPALQFLPPTKTREPDPVIRLTHVETLLLLCSTRWGRDHLRQNGVYEIVRALHENEKVDKISEHVERLVNFLKRDEGPKTANDDEITTGSSITEVSGDEDEDNMIEEV
ncbi:Protein HGH1 [Grifola frondosa]|uniref:Protein HGH1 n=1 Tax=Grifola frondosa TaxID=5627 RepID=A0A1C7M9L0_GRIFR|nr:Protein HGH1 [Grifola frondosa]